MSGFWWVRRGWRGKTDAGYWMLDAGYLEKALMVRGVVKGAGYRAQGARGKTDAGY